MYSVINYNLPNWSKRLLFWEISFFVLYVETEKIVREQSTEMHVSATFDFNPYDSSSGEYDRVEEFELASKDKIFSIESLQDYIVYAGETKKCIGDREGLYMVGNSIEEYLEYVLKEGMRQLKFFK